MPMLRITTNIQLDATRHAEVLGTVSARVAELLGKPESFVMICLQDGVVMSFAGTQEPTAYLELTSLGLTEAMTAPLSSGLCTLLSSALNIAPDRTYIQFNAPPRALFGWNAGTF